MYSIQVSVSHDTSGTAYLKLKVVYSKLALVVYIRDSVSDIEMLVAMFEVNVNINLSYGHMFCSFIFLPLSVVKES